MYEVRRRVLCNSLASVRGVCCSWDFTQTMRSNSSGNGDTASSLVAQCAPPGGLLDARSVGSSAEWHNRDWLCRLNAGDQLTQSAPVFPLSASCSKRCRSHFPVPPRPCSRVLSFPASTTVDLCAKLSNRPCAKQCDRSRSLSSMTGRQRRPLLRLLINLVGCHAFG